MQFLQFLQFVELLRQRFFPQRQRLRFLQFAELLLLGRLLCPPICALERERLGLQLLLLPLLQQLLQ